MKNIVKSMFLLALVAGFTSCEDEQDLMFLEAQADFRILTPDSQSSVTLVPEYPNNPALSISWEDANYGTPTEVTYTIQADAVGGSFESPVVLATTNNTYAVISTADLNGAAAAVGLTPFTEGGMDIRIMSTVGTENTQPLFSNKITYLVTPYSTELPKLWVPGSYQSESGYGNDWTQSTAPTLASSAFGETDYEGYVYIAENLDPSNPDVGFKFTDAPNWNAGIFGDDGTFSGVLASPGSNITLNAGYYRMQVNTGAANSYTATPTSWGIVGNATPGSWDNSTPLTYNPETKTWEGDVEIGTGKFKFRANNQWTINFGGGSDEYLAYNGADIDAPAPGNYHVVLDLSNPRKYTYTLTLNP